MANVLLDPVVVAIPTINEPEAVVEKWFLQLISWLQEISTSYHNWFYPKEVTNKLFEPGYNALPKLRALQKRHPDIDLDVPVDVINRELDSFFLRENPNCELYLKTLENKLLDLKFLIDTSSSSINVKPVEIANRWASLTISNDMLVALGTLSALKHFNDFFAKDLEFATPTLIQLVHAKQFEISAEIEDLSNNAFTNSRITEFFPLIFIPDDLPSFRRQQLIKRAKHIPASQYGKHVRGKDDAERKISAINGDGQYMIAFNDAQIMLLEKKVLQEGEILDKGTGTYHIYYTFEEDSYIGFASPSGNETNKIRVEWTNNGDVHSHPIPDSD